MTHFISRLTAAVVVFAVSAVAAIADITGGYYAYGRNADGSAYEGTVRISANADGSYGVDWSVGSNYSGVGQLNGSIFIVEWGSTNPAFYIVMPDGELHGTWADGTGLELLSRSPR